jgi:hypothetical protein
MNRTVEWQKYIKDVKDYLPDGLVDIAEKAIARAGKKPGRKLMVMIPVAGVCVAVAALTAVCNTSEKFAKTAKNNTVLRRIARALTANPNLRGITAQKSGSAVI